MYEVSVKNIAERIIHKMNAANVAHNHVRMQNRYNKEDNPVNLTKFDRELHGMLQLLKAMGIGYEIDWDDNVEDYAGFIIDGVTYPTARH